MCYILWPRSRKIPASFNVELNARRLYKVLGKSKAGVIHLQYLPGRAAVCESKCRRQACNSPNVKAENKQQFCYLITVKRLIFGDLSWWIWRGPKNRQIKQPPIHIAFINFIENITKLSQFKQQPICFKGKNRQIKQPSILIGLQYSSQIIPFYKQTVAIQSVW